uniref:Uncharacterized protein n=1 Tax=Anopheles christyi TaxID=43041 RepID=A0A182JX90_9DIPT
MASKHVDREEKRELRQTNSELMERLKQIWHSYKQISPAFRKSSVASSGEDLPEPLNDDDVSVPLHEQALNRQSRISINLSNVSTAVNSGSRPGSTAARYPAANGRPMPADTFDDAATGVVGTGRQYGNSGGGKSSRPESRTSDRPQQYAPQPKQPPELSRNNSVADYVDPKRSESRLSRSSVTNEDGVRSGVVSKEPEYGRAVEPERLSRTSDTTKPDSTGGGGASGSSGRLSRESVADQRASRQSMQSLAGSQQYGAAEGVDPATSQQYATQQQYGEFAYPAGEQYATVDDQSTAGYDPAQQQYTDQQQYEGYAEQYDQQQAYDQQQYQATPPEPAQYSSLSHQHLQQQYPPQHQQPFHHNPQHNYLPQQQQQHQPNPHHPYHRPRLPPSAAANSSQENLQSQWNRRKVTELWGIRVPAHPHGQELTDSDTSNRPVRDGKPPPLNACCSNRSLPRQQLPKTCDFQPIDSYPKLSISSPSLFGSSSDVSQTPSPTTTVLKNYDAASPNPV